MDNQQKSSLPLWAWFIIGCGSTALLGLIGLVGLRIVTSQSVSVAMPGLRSKNSEADKLLGTWRSSRNSFFIFAPNNRLVTWSSNAQGSFRNTAELGKYEVNTSTMPYHLDFIIQIRGTELRQKLVFQFTSDKQIDLTAGKNPNIRPTKIILGDSGNSIHLQKISNQTQPPQSIRVLTSEEIAKISEAESNRTKGVEAKSNLGTLGRAQQSFRLENNYFATSVSNLDARISGKFYSYQIISANQNNFYAVAKPQIPNLLSYSIAGWQDGDNFYRAICESNQPSTEPPAMPQRYGSNLSCPLGSSLIE